MLGAVVWCGCAAGTAEESKPPAPPTAAELSRFVADTRLPGYWLGPRFQGLTVSHASVNQDQVGVTYGRWSCDSGCVDSGGIWTGPRTIDSLTSFDYAGVKTKDCWRRIGRAVSVLLGCDPHAYEEEVVVFSGRQEIFVASLYTRDGQDEISASTVVRRLRPLNARAPWPLQRPARLSCREFEQVHRHYRRQMPRALRPAARC